MSAKLLGIARTTRNATKSYEALMGAFARNKRFQVNCPGMGINNVGGVSGYLGIKDIPEFAVGFAILRFEVSQWGISYMITRRQAGNFSTME